MGLNAKRTAVVSLNERMELDKKGVGIDLEGIRLTDLLKSADKKEIKHNKKSRNDSQSNENIDIDELNKYYCDEISWQSVNNLNPPFDINNCGPNKLKAVEKYDNFQPNFIERIFKFLCEKRKNKILNEISKAEKIDETVYNNYKNLHLLSENIINGNIDAYFQVIDEMRPFDKLLELGSEILIGTNDSSSIEVEFKANSEKVISKEKFQKELKEKDDITYYEYVEKYVCSSILLIARNIMNIIPVDKVIVHAVDNLFDIDKGVKNDITILSIVFDRENLNKLNLKTIDPVDALDYFICNIRHQKTSGFKSVERITHY
ncbi:MAG: hypothetical protein ACI398_06410 [Clostridium sp.]